MNEETKIEKKQWQKPELVVLVRATPEETVLSTCRFGPSFGGGTGPRAGRGGCGTSGCAYCSVYTGS